MRKKCCTDADVCVDGSISCGSSQGFPLLIRDMQPGSRISKFLGKAKVYQVDVVCLLAKPDQKIVRLDVSVQEILGVQVFNPRDELVRNHEHSLQREFFVAKLEQIFQRRTQHINYQDREIVFDAKPVQIRNTH